MENKLYNLGVEKITPINLGADWCGIYFLFDDEELVYIGKGANVYARIGTHKKNDIKFNGASYYPVANEQERDMLEVRLIWEFKPAYNVVIINPKVYLKNKMKPKYQVCTIGLDNDDKNKEDDIEDLEYAYDYPKKKYNPFPLQYVLDDSENTKNVLETIPNREKFIIINRYGLFGVKQKTLVEIGGLLEISRERVRQIQKEAERKLSHWTRMRHLKTQPAKSEAQ